ncbi:hypothetical protein B0H17DRAFT_1135088 [Mycena rosella]|uniref:Uncharacterized protein n=1 Tax=Mycena rosella TaxID=1033263 RepID=A0AAD7DDR2_MYCRO|nr:hypothetical protein B0H17DRAFT_1135088 [Mycena rosella]
MLTWSSSKNFKVEAMDLATRQWDASRKFMKFERQLRPFRYPGIKEHVLKIAIYVGRLAEEVKYGPGGFFDGSEPPWNGGRSQQHGMCERDRSEGKKVGRLDDAGSGMRGSEADARLPPNDIALKGKSHQIKRAGTCSYMATIISYRSLSVLVIAQVSVGPRGERLHHAVGLAASVRGVRGGLPRVRLNLKLRISFKMPKEGGLGGTVFPPEAKPIIHPDTV